MIRDLRRWALLALFYSAVTAVMVGPYTNFRELDKASYVGDARLIIWTLAWDNYPVLHRKPLFDSNIYYPTPQSPSRTTNILSA